MCFYATRLPTVSATNFSEPALDPKQTCPPIFELNTAFDYVVPFLMAAYLAIVLYLRMKREEYMGAFSLSFGAEVLIGLLSYVVVVNCKEFPGAARAT